MQIEPMTLAIQPTDDGFTGQGFIATMETAFGFGIEPNPNKGDRERAPSHVLTFQKKSGAIIKIGVAWENRHKPGHEYAGASMFSLSFDDPALPEWTKSMAAYAQSMDNSRPLKIEVSRERRA